MRPNLEDSLHLSLLRTATSILQSKPAAFVVAMYTRSLAVGALALCPFVLGTRLWDT